MTPKPLRSWALALRFSLASGRRFRVRVAVASGLACVAVLLGFTAVSVVAGFAHVQDVAESRTWSLVDDEADASALVRAESVWLDGRNIEVLSIAPLGRRAPAPPGLERLPRAGAYAVSPGLSAELRESAALRRLMPVDGVIAPDGVATGGELYAVRQVPARLLRTSEPIYVSGFGGGTTPMPFTVTVVPLWAPAVACLLLLGLPAVLLLGTAAKLSGAVREHRVLLMFRLGARTPALRLAMMESALLVLPGLCAGAVVWVVGISRLDRVPFVGSPLLRDAWAFGWPHALVLAGALVATASAAKALTRPRADIKAGAGETPRSASIVPLGIGIGALLLTPWLSSADRSALFLVAVAISVVGVCLALPLWFRHVGTDLRARRAFPVFMAGARLARFPRTHARGWAAMAAACALFAPLLVLVNLNVRGDTDVRSTKPSEISQFTLQLDGGDLTTLRDRLPGAVVTWAYQGGEHWAVSGSCEAAARRLELATCGDLRRSLGSNRAVVFRGDAEVPADHLVSVWIRRDANPVEALARAATAERFYALTENTTPYLQSSPLVPWLLSGIAIAVLAAMLSVVTLVIDRSMSARAVDSLDRIGLSLGVRRLVDAMTFFVSCMVAAGAGLALGVLSAIVLSRDEFAGLFPWEALASSVIGVVVLALVGAGAVAVGTNKATAVTDRSDAGSPGRG